MIDLLLFDRPARGDAFLRSVDGWSRWRRKARAIGGNDVGSFNVGGSRATLTDFYNTWLGCRLVERTFGFDAWVGMVCQLDLVLDGVNYRRTLQPEWFHNDVKVMYRYPDASDDMQAAVSYTTELGHVTFTDSGQDFNDWETTSGDAQFRIDVTNTDFSTAWGFLGAAVGATEVYIYSDIERATRGWNGEISGKTPMTYTVSDVELAGKQQEAAWAANADSVNRYGERQHIATLGSATPKQAEAVQDTHLKEFAWPRSRMVGRVAMGGRRRVREDVLTVKVMGFWHTLNWRYKESSTVGAASTLISSFVAAAEFVATGRIEDNPASCRVECTSAPQRYGDLIEEIIERGDDDGNVWRGGVYGREFVYKMAPTAVEYYLREGQLVDRAGAPVIPSLLKPGFLVENGDAPAGGQPVGGDVWDDPRVAYVEEVEFRAPDGLSLRLYGEEESIELLQQELEATAHLPASQRI